MIFDTHAHYDDEAYKEDLEDVLINNRENGVTGIVNVAASMKSCLTTVDLAHKYEDIYGAVGVHPEECKDLTEKDMELIETYCNEPKIVAVGEIGLDYYWDEPEREIQKKWFDRQLELAEKVKLPVIIHSRDAACDTLDIIKSHKSGLSGGVVHCFSYEKEMAREYLNMGFYIGVGGVVTFKNGRKLKEVVEYVPVENIVTETDCPYLSPVPLRGKRNLSANIRYVIDEIAAIKGISVDETEKILWENAFKLYPGIDK